MKPLAPLTLSRIHAVALGGWRARSHYSVSRLDRPQRWLARAPATASEAGAFPCQ